MLLDIRMDAPWVVTTLARTFLIVLMLGTAYSFAVAFLARRSAAWPLWVAWLLFVVCAGAYFTLGLYRNEAVRQVGIIPALTGTIFLMFGLPSAVTAFVVRRRVKRSAEVGVPRLALCGFAAFALSVPLGFAAAFVIDVLSSS